MTKSTFFRNHSPIPVYQKDIGVTTPNTINVLWMANTFRMELAHALDNFAYRDLKINLSEFFGVQSYDEDIIHARHPDYTVFKYIPVIREMKKVLIDLFKIQLINKDMFGRLIYDPYTPGKVWFLNSEDHTKSHVDDDTYLEHVFGKDAWSTIGAIIEAEFDQYKEVSPIGFKLNFIEALIKLIRR